MTVLPEYVDDTYLASLRLRRGMGSGEPGDRCAVQEVRAWAGLDASKDALPPGVDPLVGVLVMKLQDARVGWRDEVRFLLPHVARSQGSEALTHARALRAIGWVLCEAVPALLELVATTFEHVEACAAKELRAYALMFRDGDFDIVSPDLGGYVATMQVQAYARGFGALDHAFNLLRNRAFGLGFDLALARDLAGALGLVDFTTDVPIAIEYDFGTDLVIAHRHAVTLAGIARHARARRV